MSTISHSKPLLRTTAGLLVLGTAALGTAGLDAAAASTSPAICSSKGPSYVRHTGDVTLTARVARLRATRVGCTAARGIAGHVVKANLDGKTVTTYLGYKITDVTGCEACGPDRKFKATRTTSAGKATITFTEQGGR